MILHVTKNITTFNFNLKPFVHFFIVAKRKSLFDDKPVEIQELTYIIKQDIDSLNKQIAQLQQFVAHHKQQNGKHLQTHSNTVVVALQVNILFLIYCIFTRVVTVGNYSCQQAMYTTVTHFFKIMGILKVFSQKESSNLTASNAKRGRQKCHKVQQIWLSI